MLSGVSIWPSSSTSWSLATGEPVSPSDARFMDPEDWADLETCLETIIPTYERVNRAMSLGQVNRWRRAVWRNIRPGETVVELGSGPGQFAAGIPATTRYLVDPLPAMQKAARTLLADTATNGAHPVHHVVGTGENVPLRNGVADHVVCAYSFRDFLDKAAGLEEMFRILRPGGRLWILDVHKHERGPLAPLVRLHVRHVVPRLGRLLTPREVRAGWRGDPYAAFARTYDAFGTPDVYERMATSAGFVEVGTRALTLGGAMLLSGRRPA